MNPAQYIVSSAGRVVKTRAGYHAFVPNPLPPLIEYDSELVLALSRADAALSELAGFGALLPNPHLLISPLLRREAVLSSRIEGTQASLAEVLIAEAEELPRKHLTPDIQEVQNYVATLEYGLQRLNTLPLSLRLVRELHESLMKGVRGGKQAPGAFRRSQNWIGPPGCVLEDSVYVPPPPEEMRELLHDWERFLHSQDTMPDLVLCAIMHEQFEAIHPFLDGNGRIGRLLITLFLVERARLPQPLLYLSAYFDGNREEYYESLQRVRTHGDWRSWILFFLVGIEGTSRDSATRSAQLISLRETYRARLHDSATALRLLDELIANPFISVGRAQRALEVSAPTATKAIKRMMEKGILVQIGSARWRRRYAAQEILSILDLARAGERRAELT